MFASEGLIHFFVYVIGFVTVILTLSSAVSTFVLPRAARSQLNRMVFGLLCHMFNFILHFAKSYERRDSVMAYYAPLGLLLLLPTWYLLILLCGLVMAPQSPWSSDRAPQFNLPPLLIFKKQKLLPGKEIT